MLLFIKNLIDGFAYFILLSFEKVFYFTMSIFKDRSLKRVLLTKVILFEKEYGGNFLITLARTTIE